MSKQTEPGSASAPATGSPTGPRWIACYECNRGGRGNDVDKCACGWRKTINDGAGCFLGAPIVGKPSEPKKPTRSQERMRRFSEYGDGFNSFRDFLAWDSDKGRSWNARKSENNPAEGRPSRSENGN